MFLFFSGRHRQLFFTLRTPLLPIIILLQRFCGLQVRRRASWLKMDFIKLMDNFCLTIFKFITQLFKLRVTLTLRGGSRRHEHGEGLGVDTGRGQSFHHFVGHEHPEV